MKGKRKITHDREGIEGEMGFKVNTKKSVVINDNYMIYKLISSFSNQTLSGTAYADRFENAKTRRCPADLPVFLRRKHIISTKPVRNFVHRRVCKTDNNFIPCLLSPFYEIR
jgi:hypothetical protein